MEILCIVGVIIAYLAIGFIVTVIIHERDKFDGDEYDAVFCTVAWPLFAIVGFVQLVTWPLAALYKRLFGL